MSSSQSTENILGVLSGRNDGRNVVTVASSGGPALLVPSHAGSGTLGLPLNVGEAVGSAFRPTNPLLSAASDPGSSSGEVQKRVTALQHLYAQKQADLFLSFQQAQTHLAAQHFQYLHQLSRTYSDNMEQNENSHLPVAVSLDQLSGSAVNAGGSSWSMASSAEMMTVGSQSVGNINTATGGGGGFGSQNDLNSPTNPNPPLKRSLSHGTAQTISVHTRAKLKAMLESKQKQKEKGGAPISGSPHFEPYPPLHLPTGSGGHGSVASDFQLRKVSSEPNLKMRIRSKLLNRNQKSPTFPMTPTFKSPTGVSQRSAPVPVDGSTENPVQAFIFPSPSLPNLPANPAAGSLSDRSIFPQFDVSAALLASGGFSGGVPNPNFFFSMPSIYPLASQNAQIPQVGLTLPLSISMNPASTSISGTTSSSNSNQDITTGLGGRPLKAVDMRAFTSPLPLPMGGHPSLLKQQLRDLVLRRKSLVREETEDEIRREVSVIQQISAENGVRSEIGFALGRTGLAYDSAMCKHQCLCGHNKQHVEHGGRIHSIWARLQERGLVERCERVTARKAHLDMLKLCHSETYVTFFGISPTACLKMDHTQLPLRNFVQLPCGGIGVDSDTYFNDANTQLAARFAVGHLVELSLHVGEKKLRNGFAVIRPPGHHAEKEQAMGFCYFNNVAIAARVVQQRCVNSIKRIAIIDWDVHHGNGTQLAFEKDPNILYLSLHRHDNGNFFPGTGAVTEIGVDEGRGFTVNIPWAGCSMGDAEYLAAWRTVVVPVLDQFQPDFILVSSGFDGARGHSPALGGYQLTPQLFGYFTRQLAVYAEGKVVLALEGGYDLAAICDAAEECVAALLGLKEAGKISDESLNSLPLMQARETLQKVVAVHKKYWLKLTGEGLAMSQAEWDAMHSRFASLSVNQDG